MHLQLDLSLVSKLDCISRQVENDLAEAERVSADPLWRLRRNVAQELQLFFRRPQSQSLQSFFQLVPQIEINGFQFDLAGFDFGKVQDVIDDRE